MFPYEEGTAPTPFLLSLPALDPPLQGMATSKGSGVQT